MWGGMIILKVPCDRINHRLDNLAIPRIPVKQKIFFLHHLLLISTIADKHPDPGLAPGLPCEGSYKTRCPVGSCQASYDIAILKTAVE